ncbi:MAG: hypothetical protein OIN85_00875 [Candidatus Methanoperedens sp.]|nr:hypothetical protein [Candidatus Methanoperedens sp.]
MTANCVGVEAKLNTMGLFQQRKPFKSVQIAGVLVSGTDSLSLIRSVPSNNIRIQAASHLLSNPRTKKSTSLGTPVVAPNLFINGTTRSDFGTILRPKVLGQDAMAAPSSPSIPRRSSSFRWN